MEHKPSPRFIQKLAELQLDIKKFIKEYKKNPNPKYKAKAKIATQIHKKISTILSTPHPSNKGKGGKNKNCKDAPVGVTCIVFLRNKINWNLFRENPKALNEVLRVKRGILDKHIKEFDDFLYNFYNIAVYKDSFGKTRISPPSKEYIYDPFLNKNSYVISKKGNIQRVHQETLEDMYIKPKPKKEKPLIQIFKKSEIDENKLKEISKHFDIGMKQIEDRIYPYIPSQIMEQVDIDIINAVTDVAKKYIKLYDSFSEKNGYEEVLERNKKRYEEIKKQLTDEGNLGKITKLAEEYFNRSEDKKESDINENPELIDKHKKDSVFVESKIDALYKKGEGDENAMSPNDIKQGQVGDCFFLSSIAALARNMPEDLKNLITDNEDGTYTVTLYLREDRKSTKRTAKKIIIKPEFVEDKDGKLVYAGKGDGELWVMILEKAYAQAMGGFDNINFGFGNEAMAALTNKTPRNYSFDKIEEGKLLEILQAAVDNKNPVTISSKGQGEDKEYLDKNRFVVTGHLYSLEKIEKDQIYLHNPWGKDHLQLSVKELINYFEYASILK
jgi:hypothetical protein